MKRKADRDDRKELFEQCLYRELGVYYSSVKCADKNPLNAEMNGFKTWLSMDADREEKQRIYLLTCDRIYWQETGEQRKYNMRGKAFEDFYRTAINGRRKSNGLHGAVMEALSGTEC